MEILVLIHNRSNTGPFYKVLEQCKELSGSGTKVTLICTAETNKLSFKKTYNSDLTIIESPDLLWGKLRQGIDMWNIINRVFYIINKKYDVILAIDCRPAVILPAVLIKKIKKTPLILYWWDLFGNGATALERSGAAYSSTLGKIETFFEEYFRKFADHSIVVTSLLRKKLISFGLQTQRIKTLRVGAKRNIYPVLDKGTARKSLNLPKEAVIFCYSGTIFKRDLALLIKSLTILKIKSKIMPLTLLIGEFNIQQEVCEELNIKLIKRVPDLKELYLYFNASDYGLLPFNMSISNMARWPSKISEYMAANLPIITTPISDLGEIFNNYNIGILTNSDSENDYSAALLASLSISSDEYKCQLLGCQNIMEEELNLGHITKETLKIINNVLKTD